jgi:membrane peptidoglycan carboxypeptidase
VPTDVLGSAAVRVIDMANAYNTISAKGKKADPYFIRKVSSVVGDYGYNAHPATTQAISKDIAANLVNGMTGPLRDPEGTAYHTTGQFNRPAAGKTGTSSHYVSAWFTGFTPDQLTVSVGMYAGTGKKAGTVGLDKATHNASFYGGDTPATIWLDFMQAALQGKPVAQLPATKQVTSSTTYTPSSQPTSTSSAPPTTPSSTSSSPSSTTSTTSSTAPSPTATATTPTTSQPPSPTSPSTSKSGGPILPPTINPGGQPSSAEPQRTP